MVTVPNIDTMPRGVSARLKEQAIDLAKRKMTGQKLKDAVHFLLNHRRSPEQMEAFIKRVEPLPDLDIDPADRAFTTGISAHERGCMQTERDAGDPMRVIAERHRVSIATVSRHTTAAVKS